MCKAQESKVRLRVNKKPSAGKGSPQYAERYMKLFENMRDAFVEVSMEGNIIDCNQHYCDMLGYSVEELGALTYQELTPERWHEFEEKIVQECILPHGYSGFYEKEYRRKDGTIFPVELHTVLMRDSLGNPLSMWGFARDITAQKLAEETLIAANENLELLIAARTKELRKKDRVLLAQSRLVAMGEMIGYIAHQWRQPLNNLGLLIQQIKLFNDLNQLDHEKIDDTVARSMQVILHMSNTIDDFSDFIRPDKSKSTFNVTEIIYKVLRIVDIGIVSQNIQIELIAEKEVVIKKQNENEYSQVLLVVLQNAKEAFIERRIGEPKITITVSSDKRRSVVTIADNAGGVDNAICDKIFDPYFSTKGPAHGTGLGLFMSKMIVEKSMGGTITMYNADEGAVFRIEV